MGDKFREKNLNKHAEKQQVQIFAYRTQRVTKWFEEDETDCESCSRAFVVFL